MSNRNKFLAAGIVIVFILAGFFREFVFLNVNEQMRVTYYNSPDPHVAPAMQWLSAFSYENLYYVKWALTLLFSGLFALLAGCAVYILFRDKKLVRVAILAYAGVFVLAFLFYLAGSMSGKREVTYDVARFLAGIVETPAMLIILLASFTIIRRS